MKMTLKNVKGMSLTEIMVSVGILGVLALAGAGVMNMMMKSASTADKMSEQVALVNELSAVLANDRICTAVFSGREVNEGLDVVLNDSIQAGGVYRNKLSITGVKLRNVTKISGNTFFADIEVAGRKNGEVSGTNDFVKTARFFYQVDAQNKIITCLSEKVDPVQSCAALGGTWDILRIRCDFCASLGGKREGSRCDFTAVGGSASHNCQPIVASGNGWVASENPTSAIGEALSKVFPVYMGVRMANEGSKQYSDSELGAVDVAMTAFAKQEKGKFTCNPIAGLASGENGVQCENNGKNGMISWALVWSSVNGSGGASADRSTAAINVEFNCP